MAIAHSLVVFSLDEQHYALDLGCVQRAIRAVTVTPIPKSPPTLLGVLDLGGLIIPVMNVRECLNHAPRTMRLSDQIIIATAAKQTVALLVDETIGVTDRPQETATPIGTLLARLDLVNGAVQHREGIVIVLNLDRLVSLEETAIRHVVPNED